MTPFTLILFLAVASPSRDDLAAMHAEMVALREAVVRYEQRHGEAPGSLALVAGGVAPVDAWGGAYLLTSGGHVRSRGANGIDENGLGDDWGTDVAPRSDIQPPPSTARVAVMVTLGAAIGLLGGVACWKRRPAVRIG